MKLLVSILVATMFLASCDHREAAPSPASTQALAPNQITIAALLADPSAFHGKTVRIRGPAVGLFEVSYVCDDLATMERGSVKECLWVDAGPEQLADYQGKLVELVGRFDKNSQGHMGAYGASIAPSQIIPLGTHGFSGGPPPPEPR